MNWSVVLSQTATLAEQLILALALFCFAIVLLRNAIGLGQLLIATWVFATRIEPSEGAKELWTRYADLSLPITVVAPAFNEELSIVESTKALLALEYPEHEVIVVNDGSSDATLERLIDAFDMEEYQRIQVAELQVTAIRKHIARVDMVICSLSIRTMVVRPTRQMRVSASHEHLWSAS